VQKENDLAGDDEVVFFDQLCEGDLCLGFGATFFGPVGVEEVAAFIVGTFVGVSTEVVTLTLEQVGGEHCGAVAVEVSERARG
jgi:hypothetical protein